MQTVGSSRGVVGEGIVVISAADDYCENKAATCTCRLIVLHYLQNTIILLEYGNLRGPEFVFL